MALTTRIGMYIGQKLVRFLFLLWQVLTSALMVYFSISTNIVNKKGNFRNLCMFFPKS